MDKNFLKKQKGLLIKQKNDLEKQLSAITEHKKKGKKTVRKFIPKFLDLGQKEDDAAQEVATYEEFLALERNLEIALKGVNKTLDKMQKGKYGLCESCKKQIEKKRLEAMPAAELCLTCAKKPKTDLRHRLMFWRRR